MKLDTMLSDKFFEMSDKLKEVYAKIKEEKDKMKELYSAHKKVVDDLKAEAEAIMKEFDTEEPAPKKED